METITRENFYNMFVPVDAISKSVNSDDDTHGWYVKGIASTASKDWQGDRVDPKGMDIGYLMNGGWINYEHQNNPSSIIGYPTANTHVDSDGLHLEAKLIETAPKAQEFWELAKNLQKSGSNRRLGFSVEGSVLSRDPNDYHHLTAVSVRNVAMTVNPANTDAAWEAFSKSLTTGYETDPAQKTGGAVLRRSDLADSLAMLTYTLNRDTCDSMLKGAESTLRQNGLWNEQSAVLLLQIGRGLSRVEATNQVKKYMKEG